MQIKPKNCFVAKVYSLTPLAMLSLSGYILALCAANPELLGHEAINITLGSLIGGASALAQAARKDD